MEWPLSIAASVISTADAQKRVPPLGDRTGGSRFRATMWEGNFREATEKLNPRSP